MDQHARSAQFDDLVLYYDVSHGLLGSQKARTFAESAGASSLIWSPCGRCSDESLLRRVLKCASARGWTEPIWPGLDTNPRNPQPALPLSTLAGFGCPLRPVGTLSSSTMGELELRDLLEKHESAI